jgi:hypothetical protein
MSSTPALTLEALLPYVSARAEAESDPLSWLMKQRTVPPHVARFIAENAGIQAKARKKFGALFSDGMLFSKVNLEQSSGFEAARFKASLIQQPAVLDACGGMGIDSLAFLHAGKQVTHNEPDLFTSSIARHNHGLHGFEADYINTTAEHVVAEQLPSPSTLLYLDPSRRDGDRRVHAPGAYAPDPVSLLARLPHTQPVLLKLSPLFDTAEAARLFGHQADIYVVSLDGENRELLIHRHPAQSGKRAAVQLKRGGTPAVFDETGAEVPQKTANGLKTVLLPDPALVHARLLVSWAKSFTLTQWGTVPPVFLSSGAVPLAHYAGTVLAEGAFREADIVRLVSRLSIESLRFRFPSRRINHETLRKKLGVPDSGVFSLIVFENVNRKPFFVVSRDIEGSLSAA